MKINVVGVGYIGLPTALMLATSGADVVGTDIRKDYIEKLKSNSIKFAEKGMNEKLLKAIKKGIKFTTECEKADFYIVSVPTPYDENKKIDVTYVKTAVESILKICPDNAIIVVESTVTPGTVEKDIIPLAENRNVHFAYAPERIIPGKILKEIVENARIIGADSIETGNQVKELYAKFVTGNIVVTDIKTSEFVKCTENSFRAVNIAFANELAQICNEENIDVNEVIQLCNMHPRVNILNPGPGVGGHCIPIDPWFLLGHKSQKVSVINQSLLKNEEMPEYVFNRIKQIMAQNKISDFSKVGLYGISYKEDVDDIRNSPTLALLKVQDGFTVYDPMVCNQKITDNQKMNLNEFLEAVDMVVVMVGHTEFVQNQNLFADKVIYDTRNVCTLKNACKL